MKCPLCLKNNSEPFEIYTQEAKVKGKCGAIKCGNCNLIYLEDYSKDRSYIYNDDYYVFAKSEEKSEPLIAESKKETFRHLLGLLLKYTDPKGKKLLDLGTAKGYLLDVAAEMGFDCYGLDICKYTSEKAAERFPAKIFTGTVEEAGYGDSQFDVITVTDLIEHIRDPVSFFGEVNRIIKPGGLLLFTVPNTDSFTRKILGKNWFNYKYEHVTYWNKRAVKFVAEKYNFEILQAGKNKKRFNLIYYHHYLKKFSIFGIEKLFLFSYRFIPSPLKKVYFNNPLLGELLVIAKSNKK